MLGSVRRSCKDSADTFGTRWVTFVIFAGMIDFRARFVGIQNVIGGLTRIDYHLLMDTTLAIAVFTTIQIKDGPIELS